MLTYEIRVRHRNIGLEFYDKIFLLRSSVQLFILRYLWHVSNPHIYRPA